VGIQYPIRIRYDDVPIDGSTTCHWGTRDEKRPIGELAM
jgi:hypothetical protein